MSYKCEIIADSLSPQGHRLTTFKVTYPRIIHAEMCRHRILSRNSASSRAIPFKKMVKMVEDDPFIPIAWQFDHKGMQGGEYVTEESDFGGISARNESWLAARDYAVQQAKDLSSMDTTKQLCNRLLEPFMWHTEIISGTEWENFFELRCPKYQTPVSQTIETQRSWKDLLDNHSNPVNIDLIEKNADNWIFKLQHNKSHAEIHIQAIAELMWDAYNESTPKQLQAGEWHIPFGDKMDEEKICTHGDAVNIRPKIATARCARISYETLGDNPKINYEADLNLHDRLLTEGHMSPFEHCARAMSNIEYEYFIKGNRDYAVVEDKMFKDTTGWCNNFKGFIQYRYLIENR